MYIKTKLVKAFNELYYRKYQKTRLNPIAENITLKDIGALSDKMNEVIIEDDINLYEDENSLFAILEDIVAVEHGMSPSFSRVGREAFRKVSNISYIASNIIFSKTNKQHKTFYEVVKLLQKSKDSALVGGCVRDAILGKEPKDFDFVTSIPMDELKRIFKEAGFKVQEEGLAFLVLIVNKEGKQYEIANFRTDVYRKKPKVVKKIEGKNEQYNENNAEHNDLTLYEVVEWSSENDNDSRHPNSVKCGDLESDAQRR